MMDILGDNKIQPVPHSVQFVRVAPYQHDITDPQTNVPDLLLGEMQSASFDGNDVDLGISLQPGFQQPLSQEG